ncbi:hypothetical protein ACH9L7_09985 [Haloferax sp. S1W]|uniref:hypothetical protein n=1 Tax=Haloferax sp. S1W TaxID=3377110 RepID=UPI0037C7D769
MQDNVEFDFKDNTGSPWHPEHKGDDYDPRCGVSIRIDDSWIPGEGSYFETWEVSFLNEVLNVLSRLESGESQVKWFINRPSLLLFEKVGDDQVRVTNYYREDSIEDESKLLGIEHSGTCSFDELRDMTLQRVQTIIPHFRNADLSRADANLFHVLERNVQEGNWE